jgi:hypothetical protein
MNQALNNSAAAQDPLSNTSLLATAGVQELLENFRRQLQPLDADFAEQMHRELHQEPLTPPKSWEDGQQGFIKMALAATSYANPQCVQTALALTCTLCNRPRRRKTPTQDHHHSPSLNPLQQQA